MGKRIPLVTRRQTGMWSDALCRVGRRTRVLRPRVGRSGVGDCCRGRIPRRSSLYLVSTYRLRHGLFCERLLTPVAYTGNMYVSVATARYCSPFAPVLVAAVLALDTPLGRAVLAFDAPVVAEDESEEVELSLLSLDAREPRTPPKTAARIIQMRSTGRPIHSHLLRFFLG